MDDPPADNGTIRRDEQDFMDHRRRAFQTSAVDALKRINRELVAGKLERLDEITSDIPASNVARSRKRRRRKARATGRASAPEESA